jgi:3-methyladenine DNA glycosylase AlkD
MDDSKVVDVSQVLADLESRANQPTLTVLRAQGAAGKAYGVPMRELRRLAERYGRNDALARRLWDSSVVDARLLAVLIADPAAMSADDLDAWAHDLSFYPLIDHLTHLVVATPHAKQLIDRWIGSGQEFVERCGFLTMAELAKHDRELGDRELESKLETIEDHIRTSTTRAKEQLGAALLTIGRRNDRLQQLALEVAQKLGRIEIDHPELGRIEGDAVELLKDPELAKRLLEAVESKDSKDGNPG